MTRRLIAVDELIREEPTGADVGAWLDEHPDQLPAVRAAMRVVRQWSATNGTTWLAHPLDHLTLGSTSYDPVDGDPLEWCWWAGTGETREEGRCATKAQALDEIRRVLRAAGWTTP